MENDKIMLVYRIKIVKDNSNILLFRQVKNDPASVKLLGAFFYVSDMKSNNCIIVDPINPTFLNDAIVKCKYQLRGILSTHHHMFIQCL